jgi:hypothetical protein
MAAPKAPRDGTYRIGDREVRLHIGDMIPAGAELVPGSDAVEPDVAPETEAERGERLARTLQAAGYALEKVAE